MEGTIVTELEHLEALPLDTLKSLAASSRTANPLEAITILQLLAERSHAEEDYESMQQWHSEISNIAMEFGFSEIAADSFYQSGLACIFLDEEVQSLRAFEEARRINSELGRDSEILACLLAETDCYIMLDDFEAIIRVGKQALDLSRVLEDFSAAARAALKIAAAYQFLEDDPFGDLLEENYRIALEYAEQSLRYSIDSGDTDGICESTLECAEILTYLDKEDQALAILREAISELNNGGNYTNMYPPLLSQLYAYESRCLFYLREYQASLDSGSRALDYFFLHTPANEPTVFEADVRWTFSRCLTQLEQFDDSLFEVQRAMKLAQQCGSYDLYFRLLEEQTHTLIKSGRDIEALMIAKGAIDEYESDVVQRIPSYIYCGFIIAAAHILEDLERWEELLEITGKVHEINDYYLPVNRAIRIDYQRALALFELENKSDSIEILNGILDSYDPNSSDWDIPSALKLRGKILIHDKLTLAKKDFEEAIRMFNSQDCKEEAAEVEELLRTL